MRFAHLYSVDEHPTLSLPANVSLSKLFSKAGLKVSSVEEMSLTGNMPLADVDANKLHWPTHDPTDGKMWHTSENAVESRTLMDPNDPTFTIRLRPMELRTVIVHFEK